MTNDPRTTSSMQEQFLTITARTRDRQPTRRVSTELVISYPKQQHRHIDRFSNFYFAWKTRRWCNGHCFSANQNSGIANISSSNEPSARAGFFDCCTGICIRAYCQSGPAVNLLWPGVATWHTGDWPYAGAYGFLPYVRDWTAVFSLPVHSVGGGLEGLTGDRSICLKVADLTDITKAWTERNFFRCKFFSSKFYQTYVEGPYPARAHPQ